MKITPVIRLLVVAVCASILGTTVMAQPTAKWATASSSETGHPPEATIDKNKGERWCADSGNMPQWWMADLGSARDVSGLNIEWEFDNATYQFKVEGSTNQTDWKLLSDKTAAPGAKSGSIDIPRSSVRWLKITVTSATRADGTETWACIRTAHIKVMENGKEVEWKPQAA